MPYKKPVIEKMYYSIREVADMFNVNTSHIRFWENEFKTVKPKRNAKGNRLFTPKDIEELRLIYYLVKEKGLTLEGAKKKLKENRSETLEEHEIVKRLQDIKSLLLEIKEEL